MKNLITYLEQTGFFDNDERQVVGSVWGFLAWEHTPEYRSRTRHASPCTSPSFLAKY